MSKQKKRVAEVFIEYTSGNEGVPDIPIIEQIPKKEAKKQSTQSFSPTQRMKIAKMKFHKNCPDFLSATLHEDIPVTSFVSDDGSVMPLVEYMHRVSQVEFNEWTCQVGFWQWFLKGNEDTELLKQSLEEKAYDELKSILELSSKNDAGEADDKIVSLKLRAIELLIGKKAGGTTINKTVNNNLRIRGIPKTISRLPESVIRRDLKQLEALNQPPKRGRKKKNENV